MNASFSKFDPHTPLIQDWQGNKTLAIKQHEALRCWRVSFHRWSKATMFTIGAISLLIGFQFRHQGLLVCLACVIVGTGAIFLGDYIVQRIYKKKRPNVDEWMKYETDRDTAAMAVGMLPSRFEKLTPENRRAKFRSRRKRPKVRLITSPSGVDLAIPDSEQENLRQSGIKFKMLGKPK